MSAVSWIGLFLFTGIFQTIGSQWLYYQGAADGFSLLTLACAYFGMTLVYFYIPKNPIRYDPVELKPRESIEFRKVALISSIDFLGNLLTTLGLFLVGSGVISSK